MSKKLPAMQFYTGDWLKDTRLLSPAAKGAWIDIMVVLWDAKCRGKMAVSIQGIARLIGTSAEHVRSILMEFYEQDICDFRFHDDRHDDHDDHDDYADFHDDRHDDHHDEEKFIMICRRMVNDEEIRQKRANAGRKGGLESKPPSKEEANDKQTSKQTTSKQVSKREANRGSSTSSSTSSSNNTIHTGQSSQNVDDYTDMFEEFWELYGIKKGKKKAWLEWKKLTESDRSKIMENVPIFLTHFSSDQYTPRPRKYLYNRYWEDEDYQKPQKSTTNENQRSRADQYFDIAEESIAQFPSENTG